ncbi:tissue-type plasminogen activator-like isoform X2 [Galleria mellonella]|uniref:Tissue-type plasminogen activator-like isoform X2 n=1 Tax=Galleria mellonella TaxID=7137 RepID=A0ABM3MDI7_GALME|nr:tissue-type plasminogen activator-like isoform X2 [Galleria mellonella]
MLFKMKLNISLLRLIIKLIILLILVSVLFILSATLYSSRYWPDLYNYANANITIKRIPTITELNLTALEYVTENSTTEIDYVWSTRNFDVNTEDYMAVEDFDSPTGKIKRNAQTEEAKDYGEVPNKMVVIDYFFEDEHSNTKLIKDIIDESKLTTKDLEDVEVMSGRGAVDEVVHPICHGNITQGVFPWIAAIFVKNTTIDNQFEYYCDGALLSERVILTAGRCVTTNSTVDPEDLIVILGKKSLHSTSENEQVHRVKSVNVHENYTVKDGVAVNDLAMLVLEESADLNKDVGAACMFGEQDIIIDYQKAATTAWSLSGDLTPIYFDKEKSRACNQKNKVENTFCSTYGDDVPLCPSYGGLHATKHTDEKWYLHGIRTGDPAAKRICIKRDITYTSVINFVDWILENVQSNKN